MSDTSSSAPPTLAAAREAEARGDLSGADAIYAALHQGRAGDAAVLIPWSRLRRRVGDLRNAAAMLDEAQRGGGGAAVLVEAASLLIDQTLFDRATPLLKEAARTAGRSTALDYQVARWEAGHNNHAQALALFRAVSKAEPGHIEARLGVARILVRMRRTEEALAAYLALLKRAPGHVLATADLAVLHAREGRYRAALSLYNQLGQRGIDAAREISQVALGMMHMADWEARDALTAFLTARVAGASPCLIETFVLLAATDDTEVHRRMGERVAEAISANSAGRAMPQPRAVGPDSRRLRIGYLGGDFNRPALMLMLAGVIEAHDRSAFEVFAYDYAPREQTPARARMLRAFEHVADVGDQDAAAIAARIAADEIDILIDLKGYTERTRTEVLVVRPAPVQVSFLGYPATLGAPWVDYAIADAIVAPDSEAPHWSEAIVRLPGCVMPSDRSRPTPEPDTDRARHGLPAQGTVFAVFNNSFKISPAYFAAWMEILRQTPGSVLWLYAVNPPFMANLRNAAQAAGIDAGRLVFAEAVSLEAHLARHGCADIFLDTGPFGAHATAVDALWAGVPVITCPARSYASRVAASLLTALQVPELIARDMTEYVRAAVTLGQDRTRLAALRAHLVAARGTCALYDASRFARGLEAAFRRMAAISRAGEKPGPITIADADIPAPEETA